MQINTTQSLPPLQHSWQMCFGQGRAAELLREDCLRHITRAKAALGFRYLRFHGLFHDELSVVIRKVDGSLVFQWRMLDQIFDRLLALGIRPFIELNPMPLALASGEQTIFKWQMNVSPPSDFGDWEALVRAFTRHCAERYGYDEVRHWYFEVWNEPNLEGFWGGSQADYWELYRRAAVAVKSVDSDFQVGGPATAQGRWIPEIIAWCTANAVPLDFVSTHSYMQDELTFYPRREGSPHAPSDYLLDQFKRVQEEVAASARPDLPIHWTEWNALAASRDGRISWTENPCNDALYCGSAALHHAVRADGHCHSQSWWTISDVFGEHGHSPLPYSCAYGLFSTHDLPKPAFHAFNWLSRMRGERLALTGAEADPAHGSLVTREGDSLRMLLWFHPPVEAPEGVWTDTLELQLDHDALVTQAHLASGHGSAFECWQAWGAPANLSPTQREALEQAATPQHSAQREGPGTLRLPFHLQAYEICFIEVAPAEAASERRGILQKAQPASLEAELAGLSRENSSGDESEP